MRVTIIADASFCPDTHAAGYGYWIASDRGKKGGAGSMREPVVNNIAAEMMALINGLYEGCRLGLVAQQDQVLLQTDCQSAIDAFKGFRRSITKEELDVVKYYKELIHKMGITVQFRHVKGHTAGNDPRSYINNKCDEFAKAGMRKARAHLRRKQHETETSAVAAANRHDHHPSRVP